MRTSEILNSFFDIDVLYPVVLEFSNEKYITFYTTLIIYLVSILFTLSYMFRPTCCHLQEIKIVHECELKIRVW
jgi:hypothetical protein